MLGFLGDIHEIGDAGLHPEGHFELVNPVPKPIGGEEPTAGSMKVERANHPNLSLLLLEGITLVGNVPHPCLLRINRCIANRASLMRIGKKGGTPVLGPAMSEGRANGYEGRKIFVFRPQPI